MFKILGTDGKEYGPVTQGNVIEWIRDGRANLQTKARKGDETEWKTLGDFPEFVPTGTTPAFVPPSFVPPSRPTPEVAAVTSEAPAHREALPLAGLGRRLAAAAIDGLIYFFCLIPYLTAFNALFSARLANSEAVSFEMLLNIYSEAWPKSLPYLLVLAFVQTALLCRRSQSIGKYFVGLQIVNVQDDAPAGPVRAYLLRGLLIWLIEQIPLLGKPLFWLADSFCIFREDQRCIHDLIAGTKVVKLK
jgi:uncharacterized RDD family membrane protein YckC